MKLSLKSVSLITLSLFIISLFVFFQKNQRGTDLVEGAEIFPGLDINKVVTLKIEIPQKNTITLTRDGQEFVAKDYYSLSVNNLKINNILFDISNMQIKEEVLKQSTEKDLERYELNPGKFKYRVTLYDGAENSLISFVVGKNQAGKGNYILKNKAIFLAKTSLYYDSDIKDYLNKTIVNVDEAKIESFEYAGNKIFTAEKNGEVVVLNQSELDKEKSKPILESLSKVIQANFKNVMSYQDPSVAGINFVKELKVKLKNKLIYHFFLGSEKDKHFLKVRTLNSDVPTEVSISTETDTEEIKLIEEMANAKRFSERFNMLKSGLVFETTEKLTDLFEK